MIRLLLTILLQVAFIPTDTGSISGIVRTPDGRPAAGIRVAAMVADSSSVNSPSLVKQTQTDDSGQFSLDGIDPGGYFLLAGRLDMPTYYPGVAIRANATRIDVTRGSIRKDLQFVVPANSAEPFVSKGLQALSGRVVVESVSSAIKPPMSLSVLLRTETLLAGNAGATVLSDRTYEVSISADGSFSIPNGYQGRMWMIVRRLPAGYSVKSIRFGSADLLREQLDTRYSNGSLPEIVVTLSVDSEPKD